MDRTPFHELDASGALENDGGLRILAFEDRRHEPLHLVVERDALVGIRLKSGDRMTGEALSGARLTLSRHGAIFYVQIASVGVTPSYVDGAPVRTYRFTYRAADAPKSADQSLCLGPDDTAVVFAGDRYDEPTKTVLIDDSTTWFNIGCMGTSYARMHLQRHTTAGSDLTHHTNWRERQAMFKMLHADYCGTGHAFNDELGSLYADAQGWFPTPSLDLHLPNAQVESIEAIWTDTGAVCLQQPRLKGIVDSIDYDIAHECLTPPSCDGYHGSDLGGVLAEWRELGQVLSANAPLPSASAP